MAPRTLLRYSQLRRQSNVAPDVDQVEDPLAKGRYFDAICQVTDQVGMFVYITAGPIGGYRQVARVDVTALGKFPGIGVIIEKSSSNRCLVQVHGEVQVLPANLVPGKRYFVGLDGHLADLPPDPALGGKAAAQVVGMALEAGVLWIAPNLYPVVRVG